jgi:hypothetical protein
MRYTKPAVVGYEAIAVIQTTGQFEKMISGQELDGRPSQPAYEADE